MLAADWRDTKRRVVREVAIEGIADFATPSEPSLLAHQGVVMCLNPRWPKTVVDGHRLPATLCLSLLLLTTWSSGAARAQRGSSQATTEREYSALIESAVQEFESEHFPEARALFERAHALMPNARTLRGIGKAAFEMRDYPAAWAALRESVASSVRPLTPSMRSEVEELIRRCETFVGRAVLRGEPAGAILTVDGTEAVRDETGALLLAPGTHRLEIRVGEAPRITQPVESVAGRTSIVEVSPDASAAPLRSTALGSEPGREGDAAGSPRQEGEPHDHRDARRGLGLFLGAGAAGAVAVGGGIYWANRAHALSDCRDATDAVNVCSNEDHLATLRNVGMAITLAGAIAAPALAIGGWLQRRRTASEDEPAVVVVCAPAWAGAACVGRF